MNNDYKMKSEVMRNHLASKMEWFIINSGAWQHRRKLTEEAVKKIPVATDQEFLIKDGCPMCEHGDLLVQFESWQENDVGDWEGMDLTRAECSNSPDIISDEWEEFFAWHSDMPYVNWLPRLENLQRLLNERYRFVEDIEPTKEPIVLYLRSETTPS